MKIKIITGFKALLLTISLTLFSTIGLAQDSVERGRAKFDHSCAPCHGRGPGDDGREMLPGTYALSIKYGDTLPAALEDRTDLNSDVISVFVRMGTWSMPPFRKTELSDAEINDIADYLAEASRASE